MSDHNMQKEAAGGDAPSGQASSHAPVLYHVGTLTYTKAGLFILFTWLLWADVCFVLMESVPGLIPLKLKELNAPNWIMALMLSTIPSLLNATICPWVSFTSDRHRGPRGRRMPFILYTAPFLTIALVLIGFIDPVSRGVHGLLALTSVTVSQNTVSLVLLGLFGTLFAFFNMFVASVFWYLFNDLVPEKVLSRFLAAMRIVSTGAGAFYNFFIFPLAATHMPWIFLGGAVLYFVTFTLLCLNVKEGEYPPPPPAEGAGGALAGIKTYVRECYSIRFYWYYFLYTGLSCVGGCIGMFGLFLQLHMGLTLEQIGQIAGVGGVWSVVLLYFGGTLADRIHPLRTFVLGVGINLLLLPVGLIWLFWDPPSATWYFRFCIIWTLVTLPVNALVGISSFPAEMRIFPKERFGQFCSANALVRSLAVLVGGQVAGIFMDVMKRVHHGSDFAYRYIPAWGLVFSCLAFVCLCLLYRDWKRRGGMESFAPPQVDSLNKT